MWESNFRNFLQESFQAHPITVKGNMGRVFPQIV